MTERVHRVPGRRMGFTLIEMVACTVILSILIISVLSVAKTVKAAQVEARNKTYMAVHQLDIMERLKQMAYSESNLLSYYGTEVLGTDKFKTDAKVETAVMGDFLLYRVTLRTSERSSGMLMSNTFVLSNAGGPKVGI